MIDTEMPGTETEKVNLERLYEESIKKLKIGGLVKGKILKIGKDWIFVDIACKSDGRIPICEFVDENSSINVQVGDEVDLILLQNEDREGFAVLSKIKADRIKAWDDIIESCKTGKILNGKITRMIKGGFYVDILGLNAFLPNSHLDKVPVKAPEEFVGRSCKFKVLKYDRERPNIIVSRRAVLEEEREKQRIETLSKLEVGKVVSGRVKYITDYGAFIDIGGVDGLLHITDISWGKTTHPSAVLREGDEINLKVLKYDREDGKVCLGLKQLKPDPWATVLEKYHIGSRVEGKVMNIVDYGVFVELEEGLEGLIHISEMSWLKLSHPSQKLKLGDRVEVVVLSVNPENRRISLGMKQLEENPWDVVEKKYPKGSRVKGVVKNITDFGLFVGIEDGIDGLVHISDMSWEKLKHPAELFKKGQEIEALVLNIDKTKERFSLGIKQLERDPWQDIEEHYRPGMVITGKVTGLTEFGAFVKIEDGIEGLIHVSELNRGKKKGIDLKAGDSVEVEILNIDNAEKKIGLSLRRIIGADGES